MQFNIEGLRTAHNYDILLNRWTAFKRQYDTDTFDFERWMTYHVHISMGVNFMWPSHQDYVSGTYNTGLIGTEIPIEKYKQILINAIHNIEQQTKIYE